MNVVVASARELVPLALISLRFPPAPALAPDGMSPEQLNVPSMAAVVVHREAAEGFCQPSPVRDRHLLARLVSLSGRRHGCTLSCPTDGERVTSGTAVMRPIELLEEKFVNHRAPSALAVSCPRGCVDAGARVVRHDPAGGDAADRGAGGMSGW